MTLTVVIIINDNLFDAFSQLYLFNTYIGVQYKMILQWWRNVQQHYYTT